MRAVDPAIFLSVLVTSAGVSVGAVPNGVDLAALAGWDIVIAEDAIESEVYAAEEFQRLYKRAGEAELPVIREIAWPNRHVFVGPGGETRPDVLNISVAQNDGGAHCQCPLCAAIDEPEGTKMGAQLTFVNAVADEVAKEYSDTAPPKTLRPRNNVQIMWCSIGTCFIHAFDDQSCHQNVY